MPKKPALDPAILSAALEGLEIQKQNIDQQIAQVRSLLGRPRRGRPPASQTAASEVSAAPKKRRLSPEGRARIAAAARKRWAELKKAQGGSKLGKKKAGRAAKKSAVAESVASE